MQSAIPAMPPREYTFMMTVNIYGCECVNVYGGFGAKHMCYIL